MVIEISLRILKFGGGLFRQTIAQRAGIWRGAHSSKRANIASRTFVDFQSTHSHQRVQHTAGNVNILLDSIRDLLGG
jgi:hypothetical protein